MNDGFLWNIQNTREIKPSIQKKYSVQSEADPVNPWPIDQMLNAGLKRFVISTVELWPSSMELEVCGRKRNTLQQECEHNATLKA
mmetsp:Transcript_112345/g.177605  ORF Transcript_112345/g.177605 Transcript_112345/m.177605 type:complete len:85 (+) Transcript_112345:144-398(+)